MLKFSNEVTDKDRQLFAENLKDVWDTRIMEELGDAWETDEDGVKPINILFTLYFDKNFDRFDGLPWREVVDETLVYLFGYSARTIAARAGMLKENDDGA